MTLLRAYVEQQNKRYLHTSEGSEGAITPNGKGLDTKRDKIPQIQELLFKEVRNDRIH